MRKQFLGLVVGVLLALMIVPQAVPQSNAKQIVVDRDKVQCPKADFTSIQAAVNAAAPGDTIKVCPDQYSESVNLNKPALTLIGATNVNVGQCGAVGAADPTQDSIVTGVAYSFSFLNNDITLNGFVVQGAAHGIDTSAAFSGYRITNTIVRGNTVVGINLLSSGVNQTRVDHNCLRQNGNGLQSELGDLRNALVDHNATYSNGNSGLDFSGVGARAYVTVSQNTAVGDGGSAFTMDNSIGTSLTQNTADGPTFGIYIGGSNNGLVISGNVVTARTNGILFDQSAFIPVFPGPNVGLNVSNNTVSGAGGSGIATIAGAPNLTQSVLSNNNSSGNGGSGIRLQTLSDNNLVSNNTADKNGVNGIYANLSIGNTFAGNHMDLNVAFDARDDNFPANTWTGNHCTTDFPAGTIC
jgi:parallel beta-helix repeat protein